MITYIISKGQWPDPIVIFSFHFCAQINYYSRYFIISRTYNILIWIKNNRHKIAFGKKKLRICFLFLRLDFYVLMHNFPVRLRKYIFSIWILCVNVHHWAQMLVANGCGRYLCSILNDSIDKFEKSRGGEIYKNKYFTKLP